MIEYQEMISKIWQHLCIMTMPLVVACIVLLGLIIYGIKEKLISRIMIIGLIVIIVVILLFLSARLIGFYLDTHNDSYVVYVGDFEYVFRTNADGNQVNLLDDKNTKLRSMYLDLDGGKVYSGRVIYTQRTHWVIHLEELP